jgi:hypothetical protein
MEQLSINNVRFNTWDLGGHETGGRKKEKELEGKRKPAEDILPC